MSLPEWAFPDQTTDSKITTSVTVYPFTPFYFLDDAYHILTSNLYLFVYLFIFHLPFWNVNVIMAGNLPYSHFPNVLQ